MMAFDLFGFAWVVCGSILIATLQCGWPAAATALRQTGHIFRANPKSDAADAENLVKVARTLAARSGLWSLDQLAPKHPVTAQLLAQLLSGHGTPDVKRRIQQHLHVAKQARENAIRWWLAVADAAPALGMAGTIFGMIQLFSGSNSGNALQNGGLSLALYTTFYGLIVASIIAGPIAQRLAHLCSADDHWQRNFAHHLLSLARDFDAKTATTDA